MRIYEINWTIRQIFLKENKVILGPIKANLTITYREYQPGFAPLTAQLSFWIIPWRIILIIVGVITLLVVLIKFIKRKRIK